MATIEIGIDHIVLTVRSVERTGAFYGDALGVEVVTFGEGRRALQIGRQKVNLHEAGHEFEPKAGRPTPGSGDVCFLTDEPLDDVIVRLARLAIPIEEGPVQRTGAIGPLRSVYVRDPDGNLVEIANRADPAITSRPSSTASIASAADGGIRLSSEPAASADDVARIIDSIDRWNMEVTGIRDYHPIAIFLRDGDGEIRGGVTGGVWAGWLHIVGLWIDIPFRGRGLARDLVLAAEAEARAVGARHAFLETHSFQAPALYEKLGYVRFAELEGYPPGESELYYRKDLTRGVADGEP